MMETSDFLHRDDTSSGRQWIGCHGADGSLESVLIAALKDD